ncbi:MAG: prophage tail fiber N-terminal domain-containing protein [Hafnia sp.]
MPYRIKGTLKQPSGQPAAGVDIEFISRRNYSPLLMDLSSVIKTTSTGAYDITLEYGEYAVVVYWGCNQPSHIGKLFVFSDTAAGLDLQTLLQQADWQPATPEYIQQIQDWLAQSGASASQAVNSAAAAKASENAAEADRAEVASNKTIVVDAQADVSAKAADVTTKAAQVATNTATVNEKTPLAVAAADTASQKAVDAAASDASARDAATRAENAALAMTGAILDGGQCDLSSGFYPQPLTVNGKKYSTVWYVQVGGSVGGITYDAGDKLQYTTANSGFYFRIDARDDVVSVNGKKGAVTLNAQEVGADQAGTATALVDQHAKKDGAHPISGVDKLTEALAEKASVQQLSSAVADKATRDDVSNSISAHKAESNAHTPQNVGADPAGTAASAVLNHEKKSDPHPQYLTNAEIGGLETRVAELEKRKSTCLVNAVGTGAPHETVVSQLPATVGVDTRLVLPNPYGVNTPVEVQVQAYVNDKWGDTGWIFSVNHGYGVSGGWVQGEGIIVQTGNVMCGWSSSSGGTLGYKGENISSPLPVRVFVRRIDD